MRRPGYHEYLYSGPVKEFDTIINNKWTATTLAPSERKARSNLACRYKLEHGKALDAMIKLPGKIKVLN